MGVAGSISMTTGPREDARVELEWSSSGARVELEWSSSGARVELEWSSSGARVELDHLGHSLDLQQLWVLPNLGAPTPAYLAHNACACISSLWAVGRHVVAVMSVLHVLPSSCVPC
jgi:hypothetical protein